MKAINAFSKNTQHMQAKIHMIFAYFTLERKLMPWKPYRIRLAEEVEGRWLVLGLKSSELQPVINDENWKVAA